jgi:hypothetical protein
MNMNDVKSFPFLDFCDQTTVDGFAEALLIAMACATTEDGKLIAPCFSPIPSENIRIAKQVATAMLEARKS